MPRRMSRRMVSSALSAAAAGVSTTGAYTVCTLRVRPASSQLNMSRCSTTGPPAAARWDTAQGSVSSRGLVAILAHARFITALMPSLITWRTSRSRRGFGTARPRGALCTPSYASRGVAARAMRAVFTAQVSAGAWTFAAAAPAGAAAMWAITPCKCAGPLAATFPKMGSMFASHHARAHHYCVNIAKIVALGRSCCCGDSGRQ